MHALRGYLGFVGQRWKLPSCFYFCSGSAVRGSGPTGSREPAASSCLAGYFLRQLSASSRGSWAWQRDLPPQECREDEVCLTRERARSAHDARPREALRVNVTVPSSRWHLGSGEALRGLETHAALQAFLTCLSPVPAGSGKDFMLLFSSKSRIRHCSPFELIFCKMCWWYFRRHYSLLEIDAFNCLFSLLSARPSASLPLSFRSTSSFHVRLSSSFFGWISIALRVLIPQTRLLSLLLFLFSLVVLAVQTLPPQIAFLFPRGQKDICIFLLFPVAPSSVLNVQVGLNTFFWSLVDLLRIQNVRETCWNKHTQEILLL